VDWQEVAAALRERPYALLPAQLSADECDSLVALYDDDARFRSRVEMERHRFGIGEYKYFAYPLPPLVQELRAEAYPPLATIANGWMKALGERRRFPPTLEAFLAQCARAGQTRPTPLVLRYEAGGYNALHQDVYGDIGFPLQLVAFLSRPGADYTGGEFLLVEQRPRAQSVGEAIVAEKGRMLVFTNRIRPAAGARGAYRVNVRHGVSRVRSGRRFALGVIFHDSR
jgi:hypothetical protein